MDYFEWRTIERSDLTVHHYVFYTTQTIMVDDIMSNKAILANLKERPIQFTNSTGTSACITQTYVLMIKLMYQTQYYKGRPIQFINHTGASVCVTQTYVSLYKYTSKKHTSYN